jgi:KaiC/GvpD/RAD55 family RecA-like ATPase
MAERQTTGVSWLDERLGGGLIPGTLTVVMGATGIGKSQLGVHYAHAGKTQEGRTGVFFDMTARGDAQSQGEYAERMTGWKLAAADPRQTPEIGGFFGAERQFGDYLRVFDHTGRRVTRRDLGWDDYQMWQADINARLGTTIAFFYGNFLRGCRRVVIDGIEPADRPGESIQFDLFEYIYHQVLRKDADWVARDLFRQKFRENQAEVERRLYDPKAIGCLLLVTSPEVMLDDLIAKPLGEGDVLANANTLIYLGKIKEGGKLARGLHIAKHRGSACDEEITPFRIDDRGLQLAD